MTEAVVLDSVTSIGLGAFSGCTKPENLTIPFVGGSESTTRYNYLGYIFGETWDGSSQSDNISSSLKKVVVTGGDSIGEEAFYGCSNITTIELPDSITNIGNYAFYNCSSLKKIDYAGTSDEWETIYGDDDLSSGCIVSCSDGILVYK